MDSEDATRLLEVLGCNKIQTKSKQSGTWVNSCCPLHKDSSPSFGIWCEKEIYNCYVCKDSHGLDDLVMQVKGCSRAFARTFLEDFGVTFDKKEKKRRILKAKRVVNESKKLDRSELIPYNSGKVSFDYLTKRGFLPKTQKEFLLGWDEKKNRITFPVFDESGTLNGFVRRAALDAKDERFNALYANAEGVAIRYFIDNSIAKSSTLYPLFKFKPLKEESGYKSAIIVEGFLDSMMLHQNCFDNALSIVNAKVSEEQLNIMLKLGVDKVYLFLDNDESGENGREHFVNLVKRLKLPIQVYLPRWIDGKKDPAELDAGQVKEMLATAKSYAFAKLFNKSK